MRVYLQFYEAESLKVYLPNSNIYIQCQQDHSISVYLSMKAEIQAEFASMTTTGT